MKFFSQILPFVTSAALVFMASSLVSPLALEASSPASAPRKKLIHAGWERPDSSDFLQHIKEIENTPYDGIILMIQGKDEAGKRIPLQLAFTADQWKKEWFEENLKELKQVVSEKVSHNFIRISANPGNVDWFDDEGWTQIVEHWKIAAWLAKEGGLKGLCFDAEPYRRPFFQMKYKAQPLRTEYSFAQYQEKARERGRQVMEAIKSEYPDMTLFTFFMNSYNLKMLPGESLENRSYSLYPAFIDGWLDVAPEDMRFVDGCETAYFYEQELDFLRSAINMQQKSPMLVSPENQEKYRRQVQVSFGLYLDAFVNPKDSRYYIGPLNGSRMARLSAVASYAAQATDEYVWTWGEHHWWWPTKTSKVKPESWEEALPGIAKGLRAAFRPEQLRTEAKALFDAQKQNGTLENLLVNGSFSKEEVDKQAGEEAQAPKGWNPWQNSRGTPGTLSFDAEIDRDGTSESGSAKIAGVAVRGSFGQTLRVKAGETYYVNGWIRNRGDGFSNIRVRWKGTDKKWLDELGDTILTPSDAPPQDGWQEVETSVVVPGEAVELVLLLGGFDQGQPENAVWFDDIGVYQLEPAYP